MMRKAVQVFAWLTMVSLFAPYVLAFLLYLAGSESFFGMNVSTLISAGTIVFIANIFVFLFLEKRLKKSAPAETQPVSHPINQFRRFKSLFVKPAPRVLPPTLTPGELQLFPDELYQPTPRDIRTAGYKTGLTAAREDISENFWRVFFWIPVMIPFVFFLDSGVLNWFFLSLPIALEAIYFPMLIASWFSYKARAVRFKNGNRYSAKVVKNTEGTAAEFRRLEVESIIDGESRAFHCSVWTKYHELPDGFGRGSAVGIFYLPGQDAADLYLNPTDRFDATAGNIPDPVPVGAPATEAPRWLIALGFIWFFAAILGPPIGWGLTGGLPGIYENGTWQKWFMARLVVGGLFPLGVAIVFFAGAMFYRPMRIAGISFLVLTVLPMWSISNTWLDLSSGPQTAQLVITAFREDDDIKAKWQTEISAYRGMREGGYVARFADGRTADFRCEPICLSEPKTPEKMRNRFDKYRILIGKRCEITQFVHLNEIVGISCQEP